LAQKLKQLDQRIINFKKKKRYREILKILGIGFFIYRNIDRDILRVENEKSKLINEARNELEHLVVETNKAKSEYSENNSFISKQETEYWNQIVLKL